MIMFLCRRALRGVGFTLRPGSPPAWKPYGLEAEPEARAGVKLETGLRLGEIMGT